MEVFTELCQEDMAVIAFTHTQNAPIKLWRRYETKFHHHSGSTGHNDLPLIFAGKAVKLERVVPTFSSFIPFPSLPFVGNRRRGKVSMPEYSLK